MDNVDLSIVIINYKTPELTSNCINSIYENTVGLKFEIIVVDNHSEDNSLELISKIFPEIRYIQMNYNSGFSRANNAGIKISKGDYILFLNSDTILLDTTLDYCLNYYRKLESNNKTGLLGCKLLNKDKSLQLSSFKKFTGIFQEIKKNPIYIKLLDPKSKRKNKSLKLLVDNHKYNHNTAWLCGAFLMTNNSNLKKDKLFFDEDFFLYSEDVELAYRFRKKGYKNFFMKDSITIHIGGESSKSSEKKYLQITLSHWLYYYKTHRYIFYKIFISIIKFNFLLDSFFYKRSTNKNIESNYLLNLQQKALELEPLIKKNKNNFLRITH